MSEIVWHGNEDLRPFLIPIRDLTANPENARDHGERSIDVLCTALGRYGQERLLVANSRGVVMIGNGRLLAAQRLQWTHLAVRIDDGSTSDRELRAIALGDNRLAEYSHWHAPKLVSFLKTLEASPEHDALATVGYTSDDLGDLVRGLTMKEPERLITAEIPFDTFRAKSRWDAFVNALRKQYPEIDTTGGRVVAFITEVGV